MITIDALKQAITECEAVRNPTASTCIKLAAYYTILNGIKADDQAQTEKVAYSYSNEPYKRLEFGNAEYSNIIEQKGIENCWPVIEDMFAAVMVIEPKLYESVIRKLKDV